MFTGIVEHMGIVIEIQQLDNSVTGGGGWSMKVAEAEPILVDCRLGDSISVNGTCLTVTDFDKTWFKVGLAPETLRRTNLGDLKIGMKVNLERALAANVRFGGHFVQGHIDTTAIIKSMTPEKNSLWIKLSLSDPSYLRYIIPKGYICLDGTSLTICEVNDKEKWFTVMLVAYTQSHVIMPTKKVDDKVNIEVDMLGKYVEKIVEPMIFGNNYYGEQCDGQGEGYIEKLIKKYLDDKVIKILDEKLKSE
ncbi:2350_t:CDS:2 [Diversispora eburnea]|uniref:Riboflavin synthase n=2 Tax=Diversisporales TaxID=214509 RepID=A0A9N8YN94_9GLOM|nr:2350_t:CDS:2 [Diversispora eburnea]CAG8536559.1 5805_t:CDS:2 [Dentiscutata erythropus]